MYSNVIFNISPNAWMQGALSLLLTKIELARPHDNNVHVRTWVGHDGTHEVYGVVSTPVCLFRWLQHLCNHCLPPPTHTHELYYDIVKQFVLA